MRPHDAVAHADDARKSSVGVILSTGLHTQRAHGVPVLLWVWKLRKQVSYVLSLVERQPLDLADRRPDQACCVHGGLSAGPPSTRPRTWSSSSPARWRDGIGDADARPLPWHQQTDDCAAAHSPSPPRRGTSKPTTAAAAHSPSPPRRGSGRRPRRRAGAGVHDEAPRRQWCVLARPLASGYAASQLVEAGDGRSAREWLGTKLEKASVIRSVVVWGSSSCVHLTQASSIKTERTRPHSPLMMEVIIYFNYCLRASFQLP